MSTRSRIGIIDEDGSVRSIYCHFDGYFEGVGLELYEEYKDRASVEALIAEGDRSSLESPAEVASSTYGKDYPALKSVSVADFDDHVENSDVEYVYLFDTNDNRWLARSCYRDEWEELGDVVERLAKKSRDYVSLIQEQSGAETTPDELIACDHDIHAYAKNEGLTPKDLDGRVFVDTTKNGELMVTVVFKNGNDLDASVSNVGMITNFGIYEVTLKDIQTAVTDVTMEKDQFNEKVISESIHIDDVTNCSIVATVHPETVKEWLSDDYEDRRITGDLSYKIPSLGKDARDALRQVGVGSQFEIVLKTPDGKEAGLCKLSFDPFVENWQRINAVENAITSEYSHVWDSYQRTMSKQHEAGLEA